MKIPKEVPTIWFLFPDLKSKFCTTLWEILIQQWVNSSRLGEKLLEMARLSFHLIKLAFVLENQFK